MPIGLVIVLLCIRSRREPEWRGAARLAGVCAGLALVCLTAAALYKQAAGQPGRHWTGLEQRSLVLPALLWVAGLMLPAKPPPKETDRSPANPPG